jgi:hypothetical protein
MKDELTTNQEGSPSSRTTMSHHDPSAQIIQQLTNVLQHASHNIADTIKRNVDRKAIHNLFITFAQNAITPLIEHEELYPGSSPPIHPTSDSEELKNIQNSLQALIKVVAGLQKKPTTPVKTLPTQSPPSTYASKVSLKPANPSLVIMLS